MIFPGFPGVLSFFKVFQVEWEPCSAIFSNFSPKAQEQKLYLFITSNEVMTSS